MSNDSRIERIEDKIDSMGDTLTEINVTLGKQHESLKAHMYRTALLETAILPLQKRMHMTDGVLKLVAILAMIAEIIHLFI